ncbi:hypothetical protein EJ02DRAFT_111867 [Clathrospora elynae]|uniref:Uncharacterized protein n=1 Tax=Clathrospora elynae TaxID=706981 RepID=A0A6A5S7W4_9PLEO|nr:hypothetical protein EJ02DRAFT_111867 [Clathrospora elynae]
MFGLDDPICATRHASYGVPLRYSAGDGARVGEEAVKTDGDPQIDEAPALFRTLRVCCCCNIVPCRSASVPYLYQRPSRVYHRHPVYSASFPDYKRSLRNSTLLYFACILPPFCNHLRQRRQRPVSPSLLPASLGPAPPSLHAEASDIGFFISSLIASGITTVLTTSK